MGQPAWLPGLAGRPNSVNPGDYGQAPQVPGSGIRPAAIDLNCQSYELFSALSGTILWLLLAACSLDLVQIQAGSGTAPFRDTHQRPNFLPALSSHAAQ